MSLRASRLIAAILCTLLALSVIAVADPSPKRGGTLEFAVLVEPSNYDCYANSSFAFLHPIAPHYSTLLKFDAANYPQIVGDLAESWNVSADGLTYTFKLRPNVLFHDSSKMTSADIKASYQRLISPPPGVVSARVSTMLPSRVSTRRTRSP
jgi:peptide/nickel transport system substrate-binding protein